VKFIFADSLDYVDPRYDFIADRSPSDREPYWHDLFPHEALSGAPYDGILVSRGIADRRMATAKYTEAQARRFRMVGAREFLRYRLEAFPDSLLFGDCGAFAYHKELMPPYTPEDMIEFYEDAGFTHGCSVDHIIFQFDPNARGVEGGTEEARGRYELTLDNADRFLKASKRLGNRFTPMGAVQGWSPDSMGEAARRLKAMGYSYLAVGGMVPLKAPEIHACLDAIREAVGPDLKLHVLGFAKADQIHEFTRHGITSFDTTSPLIRSFTDEKANYYLPNGDRGLLYFTAIRIPQALENPKLMRGVKSGMLSAESLVDQERAALGALRAFDRAAASLDDALDSILVYANSMEYDLEPAARGKKISVLRTRYRATLTAKPWQSCNCAICTDVAVEVIIFRSSNRNKRRGIHNLEIFGRHVRRLNERITHA
jgi:queuine tRNA-ribosyltransferase-like protein